ncbi:LUD domain-containing protein [Thalassospira tepidiphila]|uniref:LUD domain-containing protein n=1 Tax=Thalassospira tepidiphila TaxID=393657 RepID=UPI003CCBDA7A
MSTGAVARKGRTRQYAANIPWVSGLLRTGDIEQMIQLGAHGSRHLHIVLVDESEETK